MQTSPCSDNFRREAQLRLSGDYHTLRYIAYKHAKDFPAIARFCREDSEVVHAMMHAAYRLDPWVINAYVEATRSRVDDLVRIFDMHDYAASIEKLIQHQLTKEGN